MPWALPLQSELREGFAQPDALANWRVVLAKPCLYNRHIFPRRKNHYSCRAKWGLNTQSRTLLLFQGLANSAYDKTLRGYLQTFSWTEWAGSGLNCFWNVSCLISVDLDKPSVKFNFNQYRVLSTNMQPFLPNPLDWFLLSIQKGNMPRWMPDFPLEMSGPSALICIWRRVLPSLS